MITSGTGKARMRFQLPPAARRASLAAHFGADYIVQSASSWQYIISSPVSLPGGVQAVFAKGLRLVERPGRRESHENRIRTPSFLSGTRKARNVEEKGPKSGTQRNHSRGHTARNVFGSQRWDVFDCLPEQDCQVFGKLGTCMVCSRQCCLQLLVTYMSRAYYRVESGVMDLVRGYEVQ